MRPSERAREWAKNGPDGAASGGGGDGGGTVRTAARAGAARCPLPTDALRAPVRAGEGDRAPQLPQNVSPDSMTA
jgi:hypothetical protein